MGAGKRGLCRSYSRINHAMAIRKTYSCVIFIAAPDHQHKSLVNKTRPKEKKKKNSLQFSAPPLRPAVPTKSLLSLVYFVSFFY